MADKKILAWHFTKADKRLRYNDNREVILGETLSVTSIPELCYAGLHASEKLVDAVSNAPGFILWRVEVW